MDYLTKVEMDKLAVVIAENQQRIQEIEDKLGIKFADDSIPSVDQVKQSLEDRPAKKKGERSAMVR
jgi:hypothetical protein